MDLLWKDIRYALHSLRANPGFALVSILTLALGIGATTAIFSVVNGVLLKPLPLKDPEQLVMVWERRLDRAPDETNSASPKNLVNIASQSKNVFSWFTATFDWEVSVTGHGDPELIRSAIVPRTFFPTLGVKPYLGRTFTATEVTKTGEDETVLSHALWRRKFGADPKVLGKSLVVDGEPSTIVGVMPPEFLVPKSHAEMWLASALNANSRGRSRAGIARLAPGMTIEKAQAAMNVIARRAAVADPDYNGNWGILLVPAHEQVVGDVRPALLVVLAAVALLLLIGCVNIANLLLSRATSRAKEMAVRSALGASRGQLVRQLLTESLILAILGGIVGVLLAGWFTILFVKFTPESAMVPRMSHIAIDGRVLAVAAAITLATGVFFGLFPALRASRADLQTSLKSASRAATQDRGGKLFRNALVVAEVALATVLLVGAGLLIKSFSRLGAMKPGVRPEKVLTMRVMLSDVQNQEQRQAVVNRILGEVQRVPGVERAGAIVAMHMPFTGSLSRQSFEFAGEPPRPPEERIGADIRAIAGDYFRALGIPLVSGRTFDPNAVPPQPEDDDPPPSRVEVVVNESFVRSYMRGRQPIGQRLVLEWYRPLDAVIVGVVGNVRASGLEKEPAEAIYLSYALDPNPLLALTIASKGRPQAIQVPVTEVLHGINPQMAISHVKPLESLISDTISRSRFNATMISVFAGLGLLLASVGIYGVLSYSVAQRRQEMGIRMALGADPRDVLRLVVRDGFSLAALGISIGVVLALGAARLLSTLLFGVEATDPAVFVAVSVALATVAVAASYVPARRATRVDPMVALRPE